MVSNNELNHVLLYRFLGGVFAGVRAGILLCRRAASAVSFVALSVVLNWVDEKGWNGTVIVIGTITTLVMHVGTTMFTIWDLVRSQ